MFQDPARKATSGWGGAFEAGPLKAAGDCVASQGCGAGAAACPAAVENAPCRAGAPVQWRQRDPAYVLLAIDGTWAQSKEMLRLVSCLYTAQKHHVFSNVPERLAWSPRHSCSRAWSPRQPCNSACAG
jgi:hypothetical protein